VKAQPAPARKRKPRLAPSAEIAVLSDIHSNLQALDAVLAECERRKINRFYCLGDIVGYGANPSECVKRIRALHCETVIGNHDQYVASGNIEQDVNSLARRGLEYSAEKLPANEKKWLLALPEVILAEPATLVHASLNEPLNWHYILDVEEARASLLRQTTPICFYGHTHLTRIYVMPDSPKPKPLTETKFQFPRDGLCLVNPGSVGQPRGADPRAHFAVFHPADLTVEFLKVEYDAERAALAILAAGLPSLLAERLLHGR
jgi:predicted phosphodiesterase